MNSPTPAQMESAAAVHELAARTLREAAKVTRELETKEVRAFYILGGSGRAAILGGGYKLRAPLDATVGSVFVDPVTGKEAQVHALGWGE